MDFWLTGWGWLMGWDLVDGFGLVDGLGLVAGWDLDDGLGGWLCFNAMCGSLPRFDHCSFGVKLLAYPLTLLVKSYGQHIQDLPQSEDPSPIL